jgi:hypothetical protein
LPRWCRHWHDLADPATEKGFELLRIQGPEQAIERRRMRISRNVTADFASS